VGVGEGATDTKDHAFAIVAAMERSDMDRSAATCPVGQARQVRQERPTRESQGWAILRFARVHGWPMKGALHSPIRLSWATADRNAKRAIASLISSQRASRMAEGNPPLRDRACARPDGPHVSRKDGRYSDSPASMGGQ
jgi:hypothetical protein